MIAKSFIETILILVLAGVCAWAGYKISRLNSKLWIICFCIAFPVIFLVILLNRIPIFVYQSVFSFLAEGRYEFITMAISMPFVFGLLIPRLPAKRQKIAVGILAFFGTIYFIVPPFLDPVLLYARMKNTDTWIEDGVCIQTTSCTCGAASAITALGQFGIHASERDMAIASYTSRVWGTSEHMLAGAIEKTYGNQGIFCEIKSFDTIHELVGCCPVIVVVKYRPMIDHYITILEIGADSVVVGDPLKGKERLTYAEFLKKWRKIGIIVSKNSEVPNEI